MKRFPVKRFPWKLVDTRKLFGPLQVPLKDDAFLNGPKRLLFLLFDSCAATQSIGCCLPGWLISVREARKRKDQGRKESVSVRDHILDRNLYNICYMYVYIYTYIK